MGRCGSPVRRSVWRLQLLVLLLAAGCEGRGLKEGWSGQELVDSRLSLTREAEPSEDTRSVDQSRPARSNRSVPEPPALSIANVSDSRNRT